MNRTPTEVWADALASALLGPDPIIWIWTERFGAMPWAGNGEIDVDRLAEQLQKIQDSAPGPRRSPIIYFLAPIVPGEQEI